MAEGANIEDGSKGNDSEYHLCIPIMCIPINVLKLNFGSVVLKRYVDVCCVLSVRYHC